MFNKVIMLGNLTKDIELKYTQSGVPVANTAIASSRKFTVNGEKKEEVCFIDITFFARSAEIANQHLKKGSKILIEGRLKFEQWKDQDGTNRSKHSVVVETMQMLGSKAEEQAPQQQTDYQPKHTDYQPKHTDYQPKQQVELVDRTPNLLNGWEEEIPF